MKIPNVLAGLIAICKTKKCHNIKKITVLDQKIGEYKKKTESDLFSSEVRKWAVKFENAYIL